MIKKIVIIMLVISLFIISCGTGISGNKPEGWVNNDIFRVIGKGSPSKDISDKFEREVLLPPDSQSEMVKSKLFMYY